MLEIKFATSPARWFPDIEDSDEDMENQQQPFLADSFSEHSPEEKTAAIKIQSLVRGFNVRRKTVLPSQLLPALKEALKQAGLSSKNTDNLSKMLARQILESSHNPDFEDNGKRLYKNKDNSCPADIWISRAGNHVEIEIIGKEFAHGTVKTLHKSSLLSVNLSTTAQKKSTSPITTVKFKPAETGSESDMDSESEIDPEEFFQQTVGNGQELVRQSFTPEEIKVLKIAGVLDKIDRMNPDGTREARDKLYDEGDLSQKIDKLSTAQKQLILSDIAKVLIAFHDRNLVHGDVSPGNIYLSEKGTSGHLGDPDTTAFLGTKAVGDKQGYTDAINDILQLATPFTDIFALAVSCEDAFKHDNPYQKEIGNIKNANEKVRALLKNKDEKFMDLIDELKSDDLDESEAAMKELHEQFPAFKALLQKVATQHN